MNITEIVNLDKHPMFGPSFGDACHEILNRDGALVLEGFIRPEALEAMRTEGDAKSRQAYFCTQNHSMYLSPNDPDLPEDHPRNRQVISSKGCICDDEIAQDSPLRTLYDDPTFRDLVKSTTGESSLHAYADPLSSINVHYANRGQELGWHFDNSSFAITLLIQKPDAGSKFEYVKDLRDADAGDMNYDGVEKLLNREVSPDVLSAEPGDLVLFRGRNSAHRVTPNESDKTRMLAVLAYNSQPNIELSESARMTFYGRMG